MSEAMVPLYGIIDKETETLSAVSYPGYGADRYALTQSVGTFESAAALEAAKPAASYSGSTALVGNVSYTASGGIWSPVSGGSIAAQIATAYSQRTLAADMLLSVTGSRVSYDDTASVIEPWSSLSSWVAPATPGVQVSGGNLYSVGTQGGGSGANRSLALSAAQNFRAVTTYTHVAGGGSGGLCFGVSKDAAGAVPTSAMGGAFGIYIQAYGLANSVDSSITTSTGVTLTAGVYTVTLTVDQTYISVTARKVDGSLEANVRRLRAGFACNNLFIFNSDVRALTGNYAGPVGSGVSSTAQAFSTVKPRTGIEGVSTTVHCTGDGTYDFRVALPVGFDSRRPTPVVICFHGASSNYLSWTTNANMKTAADAFLAAGYIVLTASYQSNLTTFGAAIGIAAYRAAYRYLRDNYCLGPVAIYCNSMGGIEALNAVELGYLPIPSVWVGAVPTYSLASCYTWATNNFASSINSAYGIPGSGTYEQQTAGYDPALRSRQLMGGCPMMILTASDDVAVDPAANGFALATAAAPYSREVVSVSGITGGHSFTLAPYMSQITAFIAKHLRT